LLEVLDFHDVLRGWHDPRILAGSFVVSFAFVTDDSKLTPEIFDRMFSQAAQSEWIQSVFAEELPHDVDPFSFITMSGLEGIVTW
jgi:hypothetical protein